VAFNVVVLATHIPTIVDALMVYQIGAFLLDVAWLVSGLIFWWPILAAPPGRPLLGAPGRIGYLLVGTFMHMGVGIIMTAVSYPLYKVYELAPPVGLLRVDDQQRAGGLMLGAGTLIVLTGVMLLVYAWMRAEMAAERRP
jgi:cytochrome c oxidase assembly factor CtaG